MELTLGDYSIQPDNVGVVELSHDRSLTQKLSPLLIHKAAFKRLYCDGDVHPSRYTQPTTADFSKFTCRNNTTHHIKGHIISLIS